MDIGTPHPLTAAQTGTSAQVIAERWRILEAMDEGERIRFEPNKRGHVWVKNFPHPLYPWSQYVPGDTPGSGVYTKVGDMWTSARIVEECDNRQLVSAMDMPFSTW